MTLVEPVSAAMSETWEIQFPCDWSDVFASVSSSHHDRHTCSATSAIMQWFCVAVTGFSGCGRQIVQNGSHGDEVAPVAGQAANLNIVVPARFLQERRWLSHITIR